MPRALDGQSGLCFHNTTLRSLEMLGHLLDTDERCTVLEGGDSHCAAAHERITCNSTWRHDVARPPVGQLHRGASAVTVCSGRVAAIISVSDG